MEKLDATDTKSNNVNCHLSGSYSSSEWSDYLRSVKIRLADPNETEKYRNDFLGLRLDAGKIEGKVSERP